ncbi:MAG: hypothetical protein LKF87_10090 [Clostridium tyrobutyricum]|jgi:hypothetical protein|uniref:hypothetical protein n=1 Tax=Clostridium tyrobutyricum TaxID=1519 RepID=UPI0011CAD539|nr:hypothetical protein [Clostridium tyrobutyricum]MCH4201324.1 hypothetical protein [Clostridium tyrobutyricum]MCH4259299.1 hypothetical protein [Clostridium tyrobutyricum]
MKKQLSLDHQIIIQNNMEETYAFMKGKCVTEFAHFYADFIGGFSALVLIDDSDFKNIISNPDDKYMTVKVLEYILNLSTSHPLYNRFKQFISLPTFFQEEILLQSIKFVSQ